MRDVLAILGDRVSTARQPAFHIERADDSSAVAAYRALRAKVFVEEQGLFTGHDLDDHDDDPRTVVLVARDRDGAVIGGVRLYPAVDGPDLGWWIGGRLVVAPSSRARPAEPPVGGLPDGGSSPGERPVGGPPLGELPVGELSPGGPSVGELSVGGLPAGGRSPDGPSVRGPRGGGRRDGGPPDVPAARHTAERAVEGAAPGEASRVVTFGVPAIDGGPVPTVRGGTVIAGQRVAGRHEPRTGRVGAALVRAACAYAENAGVLRFEATVQARNETMFARLGWQAVRPLTVAGTPHVLMRWPIGRIQALVNTTKRDLGSLLTGLAGLPGFVGDDGTPVPGSDLVAACDAIVPSMVERDPAWAGWCSVLVNVNDLAAMGAEPVGLLDALGARDTSFASRVLAGLRRASEAYGVPVLGGHTQLGVPAALSVTALGKAAQPVPGGGGKPGHDVRLTADLGGQWRPGYTGRQWDSTTSRRTPELRAMLASVGRARPAAAKDVSMAGIAGTLGMLAEASGCGAELDLARIPRPAGTSVGDWLTCFPGFAMLTTDEPGRGPLAAGPAVSVDCGRLVSGRGVVLRWPDGERTEVLAGGVTGLGQA